MRVLSLRFLSSVSFLSLFFLTPQPTPNPSLEGPLQGRGLCEPSVSQLTQRLYESHSGVSALVSKTCQYNRAYGRLRVNINRKRHVLTPVRTQRNIKVRDNKGIIFGSKKRLRDLLGGPGSYPVAARCRSYGSKQTKL